MPASLQKLNKNYLVVYLVLLVSLGYLIFLACSIHEGIFYAGDQALKSLQVKQIAAGYGFKYLHLGQPEWVKSIWSAGYFPLRPPFFYPSPKGYLIVYPPLFQIISAFFYSEFGAAGLYILPMACTLVLLIWFVWLLKRCGIDPVYIALAVFILVFCSPLMLYGVMFWEHLPAVLLLFAGVSLIAAPPAKRWTAGMLGICCGLAVWFRPEALMMVFLYGMAVAILFFRERRAVYVAFGIGIALAILPWFAFNVAEYGSLFGIHGQQVLQDNDPDSRMSLHNGWRNLTIINDNSLRHFWFLLLLLPVVYQAIRYKNAGIRALLLALVVIGYSLFTPFMLPNDGVVQWGPRYFLGIIPVTLVALFLAAKQWDLRTRRPIPVWLTLLIVVAGVLSFYRNTHGGGYKELRWRYNSRLTDIYQLLNSKPGSAVVASPHFLSYDFGYLFDKTYFFGATGDDSLRRLLPLLRSHGVHEIICLYNPRFYTLPPMLQDSTTRHRFDPEAATGWIKEDVAYKVYNLDSTSNQISVHR
ncbi:MAG TPA: hypothetical protein VFE32_19010 [Puia sp.]|nr:hypothetical protein [Puia sp.]